MIRVLDNDLDKRRRVLLPLFILVGIGAIGVAVYLIYLTPSTNPLTQYGVGANGFHAYAETGTDLGIGKLVKKSVVVSALGDKAKANSVSDVQISNVFNYNDDRAQTATFTFERTDSIQASVYADMMHFKNQAEYDSAKLTANTLDAGIINGRQAYFMLSQAVGNTQEYRLMLLNGLTAYKFVMVQPINNVQINEVSSLAIMKKIADQAQF